MRKTKESVHETNPDSDMYSGSQMSLASCWQQARQVKRGVTGTSCGTSLEILSFILLFVSKHIAPEVSVTLINTHCAMGSDLNKYTRWYKYDRD